MKEINGFPAYPIYSYSFKWSEDGVQDPQYPNRHKGLPEGRIWNSTSFSKMLKEEISDEEVQKIANDWFAEYVKRNASEDGKSKNISDVQITAKLKEYETWNLTWFQHETFDVGQTNEEALNSFDDFVTRAEIFNNEIKRKTGEEYGNGSKALMGAEDRWRWHGAEPSGGPDDHSPAPCRCKFCKEQGVIRIAH